MAGLLFIILKIKSILRCTNIVVNVIYSEYCTIRDIDEATGTVVLSFNVFDKDVTKPITDIQVWIVYYLHP